MSCVSHAFAARPDLLALACDVYCDFVTFTFGILGQVWYLIVSIPDPCCLSYFYSQTKTQKHSVHCYDCVVELLIL